MNQKLIVHIIASTEITKTNFSLIIKDTNHFEKSKHLLTQIETE